jgi:amphi-Trp domain-containing protein
MSDVKLESKESVSRAEAADLLAMLASAFTAGGHTELPFGPGTVTLHIPDRVRAEFEVEVDGDEIELEIEFTWSMAPHPPGPPAARADEERDHGSADGRPPGKKPRSKQRPR